MKVSFSYFLVALKRAFGFEVILTILDLLTVGLGLAACRLLGQEHGLDIGQHSSLSNCDARKQLVQLLIVPDSKLEVPWDDPGLLVVPSGVAGQLEDLGGQVLHHGRKVDRGTSSNPLGIVALPEKPVDPADRELKSSPA